MIKKVKNGEFFIKKLAIMETADRQAHSSNRNTVNRVKNFFVFKIIFMAFFHDQQKRHRLVVTPMLSDSFLPAIFNFFYDFKHNF